MFVRPLLNLFATAAVFLLCACTITSPTQLVGADEGATPLPANIVVYGYRQGDDGAYTRTEEAPIGFRQAERTYISADNSMTMRFVPLDGNGYLLSVSGNEPGALYGTAWVKGQIVVIRMILADDVGEAVEKAKSALPPDLATDISGSKDGLSVTRRETLDQLVSLIRKGTVPTEPLVAWIAEDPDAPTPARIEKTTDGWKAK
jgi:hypothetical protein